jgi:gliding motility-associated-like protein
MNIQLNITNTTLLGNCPNNLTQTIQVISRPSFDVQVSNLYPCVDEPVVFQNLINDYHLWSFHDNVNANQSTFTRAFSTPGTYTVSLTTGINGYPCFNDTSFVITVFPIPDSDFEVAIIDDCQNPVEVQCITDTTGNTALTWYIDNVLTSVDAEPLFTFTQSGTYLITLIEENIVGCSDTISKTVEVNIPPTLNVPRFQSRGCAPFTVDVGLNIDSNTCFIDLGDGTISNDCNIIHTYSDTGSYTIDIQVIQTDCIVDTAIEIQVRPKLEVEAIADPYWVKLGDKTTLKVILPDALDTINVENVFWQADTILNGDFECATCPKTDVLPFTDPSNYSVYIKDEDGCEASDTVRVDLSKIDVFVPNAFTPNGDGHNDEFYLHAKSGLIKQIISFKIFNRWGALVFEANNIPPNEPNVGWKPKYERAGETKFFNPAVFVYVIEVEYVDGEREVLMGDVTLIR